MVYSVLYGHYFVSGSHDNTVDLMATTFVSGGHDNTLYVVDLVDTTLSLVAMTTLCML